MALQPVSVSVPAPSHRGTRRLPSEWESHVYQLDAAAALELGFSLGSVKVTDDSHLLVMDTVRSETVRKGRRTQRWGCGYRLEVAVSDIKAVGKLSLPAIAASVEVGSAEASVTLTVKGYPDDDLWDVIPPPRPLDVETYRNYLEAAATIQGRFKKLGSRAVVVLLATDDPRSDMLIEGISEADLEAAAAAVWALRSLADHSVLAQALEGFPDEAPELREVIEGTYRAIRGAAYDSPDPVSDVEASVARAKLSLTGLG